MKDELVVLDYIRGFIRAAFQMVAQNLEGDQLNWNDLVREVLDAVYFLAFGITGLVVLYCLYWIIYGG